MTLPARASLSFCIAAIVMASPQAGQDLRIRFTDVTSSSGLASFVNVSGTPTKDFITDANGNGVAFFDYDNDRDLDVLLVSGSTLEALFKGGHQMVALYRNDGARFTDVTKASGLIRRGWGTGVCIADYDNDGFEDVYVTAFGPNVLWRNVDGRTFTATRQAQDPRWSTGCAFGDYDRDGHVDLYVANYVRFVPGNVPMRGQSECGRFMNIDSFCGPRPLPGEPDTLYRNDGKGVFTNVTRSAGIVDPGHYGFGVVFSDLDDDGWLDIFVANDSTPNLFFQNRRNGTFSERALQSGLAVSADGREQAGMGVDVGDYNGDGRLDLVKTNFAQDYTSLYRNEGNGLFVDASFRSGLAATLGPYLGWGVGFIDVDNDALLDVFIANGHVYPDVEKTGTSSYRQRNQLFRNVGRGQYRHITMQVAGPLLTQQSSRGAAFGDYDNDGDTDILVSVIDDRPILLRNDSTGGHWVTFRLEGKTSNRSAIGARVTVQAGSRRQVAEVRSGGSYISHNDTRVHFGLGTAASVDRVIVRWPNGTVETLGGASADRFYVVRERAGMEPGR
ncbi:MAG TPA: CRTAC1 family protein [Vicinamibacterales bacterium]|nr:CRTAC1 family protein [Vicinamibacterales bacterium]